MIEIISCKDKFPMFIFFSSTVLGVENKIQKYNKCIEIQTIVNSFLAVLCISRKNITNQLQCVE